MRKLLIFLLLAATFSVAAQQGNPKYPEGTVFPPGQTPIHDPSMIKEADTFYLFATGQGISVLSSKDAKSWTKEKPVFETAPDWTASCATDFKGHIWAPDISFHKGLFYLYYSVSSFAKNSSCIGVAVNRTLDRSSPEFGWVDKGRVLQSVPNRDMWNAIDPNLVFDEEGVPWLAFGSFWEGIKLVKMNPNLLRPAEGEIWYSVARRKRDFDLADALPGNGAVEAPFIYKKGDFYYLFISVDYCCRGEKSDYKIVYGRSQKINGPYLDRQGRDLIEGGGTILRQGDKNWYGVGHNAVYKVGDREYLIYHGYDAKDKGRSKLLIGELSWTPDGWPK
ncbi:MAG: arabinan endo-1,5-alpha-L-arabinosidase [Pyrinomonadaceae bacterium]